MQTSAGIPLDLRDTANGEPCPMERLADRMKDEPPPKWCVVEADRMTDGSVVYSIRGALTDVSKIDDLINYLARVKG